MKKIYLDLMEKVLSAYTNEDIQAYYSEVKKNGIKEHGFPRLTANIGIMISNGRRLDLIPIFKDMMDICCYSFPRYKAAHDFSVREIVATLRELEESGVLPASDLERWKSELRTIRPENTYDRFARSVDDDENNWALFTGVSEYYRKSYGLGGDQDFIDLQVEQQLQFFDENGMYCDAETYLYNPIVYDLVPRGLYCLLLNEGYDGPLREKIDGILKKAALNTLKMQSPTGEIGFGGRSNQFLHNEAWIAIITEYEAKRYKAEGDMDLAKKYRSRTLSAINSIISYLKKDPIRHIKNYFDRRGGYGCEHYAYFDKYMISVASILYGAYSIRDDSIPAIPVADTDSAAFLTSERFAKLFLKSGGYGLEFELNANEHYDANGLGRIHKADSPSYIALSCPCPAHPSYKVDSSTPLPLSAGSAIRNEGGWTTVADGTADYKVIDYGEAKEGAFASIKADFGEASLTEDYSISSEGVQITITGNNRAAYSIPALYFDGENYSQITDGGSSLTVDYSGYRCLWQTNGIIEPDNGLYMNRNGYYKRFIASGTSPLTLKVTIEKIT